MKNKLNELIMLMQKRINILTQINDLTLLQQDLIVNDTDKLVLNIEERQELIDRLKDINELIKSAYSEADFINAQNEEYNDEISALNSMKESANVMLESIYKIDQKNELAIKGKMEELRRSIKNINDNKKGITVYNMMSSSTESLYFDKNR